MVNPFAAKIFTISLIFTISFVRFWAWALGDLCEIMALGLVSK
jgi:hypothetical protein